MALAAGDTGLPGCTSVSAVLTIEPSLRRSTEAISTIASFVASRPVVSMSKQRMIICRLGRATLQHPLPPEVFLECYPLLVRICVARTGGTVSTTPQPTHSLGSVSAKPVLRRSSKPAVVVNANFSGSSTTTVFVCSLIRFSKLYISFLSFYCF